MKSKEKAEAERERAEIIKNLSDWLNTVVEPPKKKGKK